MPKINTNNTHKPVGKIVFDGPRGKYMVREESLESWTNT